MAGPALKVRHVAIDIRYMRASINGKMTLLAAALLVMSIPCALASGLTPRDVDAQAIGTIEQASDNWLSNGRTYGEQRYSPLRQINAGNVAHIGKASTMCSIASRVSFWPPIASSM